MGEASAAAEATGAGPVGPGGPGGGEGGPLSSEASEAGREVSVETVRRAETRRCGGCGQGIGDRYLLKALDQWWHEDCLKCGCCGCRLAEAASSCFVKQGLLLCKRDYLRMFGLTGVCAACRKEIPAFEMVMRARDKVYHLECFACQECAHRFCVGDKFYLAEGKILCEYDYEERLVFAQMAYNFNSLAHLKQRFADEDDQDAPAPNVPHPVPNGAHHPPPPHAITHGPPPLPSR